MYYYKLFYEEEYKSAPDVRILDFDLGSGFINAKVSKFGEKTAEINISFPKNNTFFAEVTKTISENCYFLSALMADTPIIEMQEMLHNNIDVSKCEVKINKKKSDLDNPKCRACISRLSELIENSYWNFFLVFGITKDELISEISRNRKKNKDSIDNIDNTTALEKEDIDNIWQLDSKIFNLKYSIVADEIPAAMLRRLDPLPLEGLEEKADSQFVEAYERVTRMAQSYGLSLMNEEQEKDSNNNYIQEKINNS